MDGADWIRGRLGGLACAACGRPYRRQRIRVLAQREALFFVDLACADCGSQAVAIVSIEDDAARGARLELGEMAEGSPVSAADVLEMHHFLERFDGDFRHLFGSSRRGPSGMSDE